MPAADTLIRDVRYGVRLLGRHPGVSAAAILSLALGIGANTAVFTVTNALMLRTLPVPAPGRLVQLLVGDAHTTWTYPLWSDLRAHADRLGGVFAWSVDRFDLSQGGTVEPADGLRVSGGFFDALGVAPVVGRGFTPQDDLRGGGADGAVAVISYAFWQRRFGGAPDVVGRPLSIDRVPFTIVGVTPAAFTGPDVGTSYDVAVPIGASPQLDGRDRLDERGHWWLHVMARLPPGRTVAAEAAALDGLQPALRAATLPTGQPSAIQARYLQQPMQVVPAAGGPSNVRRYYRQPLLALTFVVALVLLVACANIASLLLARGDARRHEVSVRLALGASRGRLIRQFLVESLVLAAAGAAVGALLAAWGSRLLVAAFGSPGDPLFLDVSVDWRVLAFTAAVTVTVAFLFGAAPAFRATRVDPQDALREHGRGASAERRGPVARLVVPAEVALCVTLVAGAGLFLRTLGALEHRPLGFDADRLLVVSVDGRTSPTPPPARFAEYDRIVAVVRALPGVADAALSAVLPLSGNEWDSEIQNPPGLSLSDDERDVYINAITPGWFATYGIPLIAGRGFQPSDAVPGSTAVVVNQTAARRFFPGHEAVGAIIRQASTDGSPTAYTVVGVARDAVYDSLRDPVPPTMYQPLGPGPTVNLTVRAASGDPASLGPSVAAAIARVDPTLALTIHPLTWGVDDVLLRERLLAELSAFFGALALGLAALGIYGVIAYTVARRRQEIGIRLALGASASGIVRAVVGHTAALAGVGLAIGVVATAWASRFAASLLYGLGPGDPWTLAGAALVLAAVAALASWLPARRAARIDPARVLRDA